MKPTLAGRLLPFLFFIAALALHLRLAAGPEGAIGGHQLLDTDSYTRLMRVEQLWQGTGWYDNVVQRMGAPEGMPLHWTRPLDLLILGPAMLAATLGVPPADALWWSGVLICPVLHIIACLLAVWAARALWPGPESWFAAVILLAQPVVLAYGAAGRADHHVLILLLGVVLVGAALRAVLDPGRRLLAWGAGWAGAGAVWVGPEGLLLVVPALAAFGLLFVFDRRGGGAMAGQGLRLAAGYALGIALAFVVDVAPEHWTVIEHDRLSIVHVGLGLAFVFVFGGCRLAFHLPWLREGKPLRVAAARALAGGALSLVGILGLALAFPGFERASLAFTDPLMQRVIGRVTEMQPFRLDGAAGWFDLARQGGGIVVAVIYLALAPWRAGPGPRRRALVLLALMAVATLAAGLSFRRFLVEYAAVAAIGLVGLAVAAAASLAALRAVPRIAGLVLLTLGLTVGVPAAGMMMKARNASDAGRCDGRGLIAALATVRAPGVRGPSDPILLSDDINIGPRVAFESAFRVVAAPYHRGIAPLGDAEAVFAATRDEDALAILRRRGIGYIALCLEGGGGILRRIAPGGFGDRLAAGNLPSFLKRLQNTTKMDQSFALFEMESAIETPR